MVTDLTSLQTSYVCDVATVYEFAQVQASLRTPANEAMIESLIVRTVQEIEDKIGRRIIPKQDTITIHSGRFCTIIDDLIFMRSVYYDINGITSITEDGILLTENTDYVIQKPNMIQRINNSWSTNIMGIVIDGVFGMGYSMAFDYTMGDIQFDVDYAPHKALKQIVVEEVAIKAGLVKYVSIDGDGNGFQNTRTNLSEMTRKALEGYKQPVVV